MYLKITKSFSITFFVLFLALTVNNMAQNNNSSDLKNTNQDEITKGAADGERDAKEDVSGVLWIGVGCCTGGFSWLYPEIFDMSVPQTKIVGKSADYVQSYMASYRAEKKSKIQTNSCIGGGIYWGSFAVLYIIAIAASTNK
jgi:hypothetical protein